jgi:hypothetical protein
MTKAQLIPLVVTAVLALAALAWQITSWRRTGSKITAELGIGQVDEEGVLTVEFSPGRSYILRLKEPPADVHVPIRPKRSKTSGEEKKPEEEHAATGSSGEFSPVNAIFIHNGGRTAVTIRRCHYISDFFQFEPQPGVSPWGDHLPKRIDPGDEAILVHDFPSMKTFLNHVMHHEEVDDGVFAVVLNLGAKDEILVNARMHIRRDMDRQELAESAPLLRRQEMRSVGTFSRRTIFDRRRPLRRK